MPAGPGAPTMGAGWTGPAPPDGTPCRAPAPRGIAPNPPLTQIPGRHQEAIRRSSTMQARTRSLIPLTGVVASLALVLALAPGGPPAATAAAPPGTCLGAASLPCSASAGQTYAGVTLGAAGN